MPSVSPVPQSPCVLIIMDGWGLAPPGPGNAITSARTPNLDRYWALGRHSVLEASGLAVGLPEGQIGNSEVGHLNLGAGFRVLQELPRIDHEIETEAFFQNPALVSAVDRARDRGRTLHLLGLFSNGGVHSHARHLYALLQLAARRALRRVSVHAFLDGRDTPPQQALADLPELQGELAKTGVGRIATVTTGRYYAMDRNRWDRPYPAPSPGPGRARPQRRATFNKLTASGTTDDSFPYRRGHSPHFREVPPGHYPGWRQRAVVQLPGKPRPPASPCSAGLCWL